VDGYFELGYKIQRGLSAAKPAFYCCAFRFTAAIYMVCCNYLPFCESSVLLSCLTLVLITDDNPFGCTALLYVIRRNKPALATCNNAKVYVLQCCQFSIV